MSEFTVKVKHEPGTVWPWVAFVEKAEQWSGDTCLLAWTRRGLERKIKREIRRQSKPRYVAELTYGADGNQVHA